MTRRIPVSASAPQTNLPQLVSTNLYSSASSCTPHLLYQRTPITSIIRLCLYHTSDRISFRDVSKMDRSLDEIIAERPVRLSQHTVTSMDLIQRQPEPSNALLTGANQQTQSQPQNQNRGRRPQGRRRDGVKKVTPTPKTGVLQDHRNADLIQSSSTSRSSLLSSLRPILAHRDGPNSQASQCLTRLFLSSVSLWSDRKAARKKY